MTGILKLSQSGTQPDSAPQEGSVTDNVRKCTSGDWYCGYESTIGACADGQSATPPWSCWAEKRCRGRNRVAPGFLLRPDRDAFRFDRVRTLNARNPRICAA